MKKLTQSQIEAMAAKLNANGLGPGARVFDVDVELGEWEQLRDKLADDVSEYIARTGAPKLKFGDE